MSTTAANQVDFFLRLKLVLKQHVLFATILGSKLDKGAFYRKKEKQQFQLIVGLIAAADQ